MKKKVWIAGHGAVLCTLPISRSLNRWVYGSAPVCAPPKLPMLRNAYNRQLRIPDRLYR